jgi:hypothetical protein
MRLLLLTTLDGDVQLGLRAQPLTSGIVYVSHPRSHPREALLARL